MNIGADELILWIRKNGKAVGISNDKIGNDISDLIQNKLNGKITDKDKPVYWDADGKNIAPDNLPKTAAQYTIDSKMLPALFNTIDKW